VSREDAAARVSENMNAAERQKFLDRMTGKRNPRLRGAHVEDILDMLWEHDAYLGVLEPFYERNEALWKAAESSGDAAQRWALSYASIAAVVLLEYEALADEPPHVVPPDDMLPLVKRLAGVTA
jgi:hypothetical protein